MIAVVCVWNNQDCDYELISIDNRNHTFTSCVAALNYGADHSTGEILVFVHQDISFEKNHLSKNLAYLLNHILT